MWESGRGPYRATALWSEAVLLFRDSMLLREHRHRLHKHKNSFTGHEAVTFLHNVLRSSLLFNPQVTREQSSQLLKQFLKADLISPVKNCSISNSKCTFHDSHKYLYEFTENLIGFQRLQPLSGSNFKEKSRIFHISYADTDSEKENSKLSNDENIWKTSIIDRLRVLLKPLDTDELFNTNEIDCKWVATNANPEWKKLKWNTELPHWILSAMQDLLKYTSKDHCGSAYPQFEIDAFKVISDHFQTLETPIIIQPLYNAYIRVFSYLEYLNCLDAIRSPKKAMSSSREDLIYKLSSPKRHVKKINSLSMDRPLPPNLCYEAAFTADDPTIRVVPQCSVDSIHLQKRSPPSTNCELSRKQLSDNYKKCNLRYKKTPLRPIENCIPPIRNRSNKIKTGIVNEGFATFSPNNINKITKYKSEDCLNYRTISNDKCPYKGSHNNAHSNSGYVNLGLSFSLEDMNLLVNELDYNYALESVNRLLKITKSNQSLSDDEPSFHTAFSFSDMHVSDTESSPENVFHQSYDVNWGPRVFELGITIFQLLLMLLPPCNRAQLKHLTILMFEMSRNSSLSNLSLENMLLKLNQSILRPLNNEVSDIATINKLLSFFVEYHEELFAELQPELLSTIKKVHEQSEKLTFCEQISEQQFEIQKTEESTIALNKLLNHIIDNSAISEKERKKHLKMFRDSYPGIYKKRFPNENGALKSKVLFSLKSFRL